MPKKEASARLGASAGFCAAMLLLLFAAAAPGKERAALQADLDSLATTLDSMLGFEKMQAAAAGPPTDEEMAAMTTFATSAPPRYLYHAAKAEYFKSFHDSGFSRTAKLAGATASQQATPEGDRESSEGKFGRHG